MRRGDGFSVGMRTRCDAHACTCELRMRAYEEGMGGRRA